MIVAPLLLAAAASAGVVETITAERVLPDGRFEGLARWTAPGRPSLALALSGGGARGIAHVGVAAALEEDGVELDAIAGTSMGALIGGFLSAGYDPREVQSILDTRDWNAIIVPVDRRQRVLSEVEDIRDVAALVRLRRTPGRPSAVGGLVETRLLDRELYRYFLPAEIVSGGSFDDLRYRFRPVATDILTGKEVVPDSGDLVKAIRGSSAIPGVFKPVRWGDASLVDGGLVENLPSRTARTFGTDVVLGVDVGDVVPAKPVQGTFDALNRSVTILTAAQLEDARKLADLVIAPAVSGISQANFSRNVDALVTAGRDAYATRREALWRLLESKCADPRRIDYDAVEVVGSPWIDGAELARRLGGERGSVTRFRLAAELARALNLGPHVDGKIEIVAGESGTTVRMVLEPSSVVRAIRVTGAAVPSPETMGLPSIEGERFSLAEGRRVHAAARRYLVERGRILVFLGLASWRDDAGVLEADIRELSVGDVDVAVEGPLDLDPMRRLFRDVKGGAFRFDRLADRLDELVVRGVIEDWSLDPSLAPDGSVDVTVRARGESYWEGSAGVAWHDAYEWSAFGRLTRGNLFGRGDATELVVFGAKELQGATLRFRSEFLGGFKNLGLEAGLTFAERQVPVVDARQRFSDEDWEEERLDRAWVHLLRRLRFGIAASFGIDRGHDRLFESATGPALVRDTTALSLRLDLDRHDRLLFPTRGGSARLDVTHTIGGETLDRSELVFDQVFGIGEDAPVTVTLRGGAGTSRGASRRVDWFDPGGYRDLYGFIPYGAAAPHYARAGLVTRLRTLELGPLAIYFEAGADAVRTAATRRDLSRARTVLGYGVSATAFVRPVGPLTLGYSRNDDGATELFLTVGYDFLDR